MPVVVFFWCLSAIFWLCVFVFVSVSDNVRRRLGGGVLGDSLGALGDGVLGELTREEEADSGLDLTGGEGLGLVVASELATLLGDLGLNVVDERVHDGHGLLGDASVRVDLLEDLEDVGVVRLGGLLPPLLGGLLGALLGGLLGGLWGLWSHFLLPSLSTFQLIAQTRNLATLTGLKRIEFDRYGPHSSFSNRFRPVLLSQAPRAR